MDQQSMNKSSIKVAVIQLYSEPFQLDLNYERAVALIRSAATEGAVLIVLPEYHLSSWAPEDARFKAVAERYDEFLSKYCHLAKELNVCIVPGTIIAKAEGDADELVNIAAFIDNAGKVLHTYTKKNLWLPERAHLTAGISEPHTAFDTPFGRLGLLICWDLAFPEAFRELIVQGAELIIAPAFWLNTDGQTEEGVIYNPQSEEIFLDALLVCRAFENTCAVVFCNTGGSSQEFLGISQVTLPLIGRIARLPDKRESTLLVDLDLDVAKAAERTYKIRADLGRTNWHYG